MKKIKIGLGVLAAAAVCVTAIAFAAKGDGKSLSSAWGDILKSHADSQTMARNAEDEEEALYARGKTVSISMDEYEQVKEFYLLRGDSEEEAEKNADKEIKEYTALYGAAVEKGYSVTEEEVEEYIEYLKTEFENAGNREDLKEVMAAFDSEEDYWAYELKVYRKQLPIQNYVADLNEEYCKSAGKIGLSEEEQSSWDTYFANLKAELVEEEEFQMVGTTEK